MMLVGAAPQLPLNMRAAPLPSLTAPSASLWMGAACAGLLHHVRQPQVAQAAALLCAIDAAEGPVDAIHELLQVGEGWGCCVRRWERPFVRCSVRAAGAPSRCLAAQ
jgi:hypothetical protein